MKATKWALPVSVLFFSVTAFAAPKAEFKSTTFDCGSVIEGKTDILHAEFILSNTGNETLKITNVRPGCGCTNVKFDSTVAPGKSMTLKSDVNIKGYHSGPLSKSISFTSNASADPVKLVIQAQITSPVSVNERYIKLDSTSKAKPYSVDVLSTKKELKITGVTFKVNHSTEKGSWQPDLPMDIKYTLVPFDTVRADSLNVFKLHMFTPQVKGTHHGDFKIETDNPEKKDVVVQGIILN